MHLISSYKIRSVNKKAKSKELFGRPKLSPDISFEYLFENWWSDKLRFLSVKKMPKAGRRRLWADSRPHQRRGGQDHNGQAGGKHQGAQGDVYREEEHHWGEAERVRQLNNEHPLHRSDSNHFQHQLVGQRCLLEDKSSFFLIQFCASFVGDIFKY